MTKHFSGEKKDRKAYERMLITNKSQEECFWRGWDYEGEGSGDEKFILGHPQCLGFFNNHTLKTWTWIFWPHLGCKT